MGDGVGSGGAQPVKLRMRTARAPSARGGGVGDVLHGRRGLGTPDLLCSNSHRGATGLGTAADAHQRIRGGGMGLASSRVLGRLEPGR